ncbi:MAG: sterol desaturase family protein [Chlorobiota bacterium]|nr:sterol desaturase family protein [Chlorobiota bacterium]QQS67372.1 MAG: sterol desaturase family protein [Chlorobiota bacterium]
MESINFFKVLKSAFEQYPAIYLKSTFTLSFSNTALWALIAGITFLITETILPKRFDYDVLKRKGFWLDLFYHLFNHHIVQLLGLFAICYAVDYKFKDFIKWVGFEIKPRLIISEFNFWWQFLILFIIQDFLEYVTHVIMHKIPFMWEIHRIHHAQKEMGFASTHHFHWVEFFFFKIAFYLPFGLLGYSFQDYFVIQYIINIFNSFFTHSNIKCKFGFVNYIINTPETHHWHHAYNIKKKYGVNFASILNCWDYLFGTIYLPIDIEPILGDEKKSKVPATFIGQFFYPFKQIYKIAKRDPKKLFRD